jgi:hypothetical protein
MIVLKLFRIDLSLSQYVFKPADLVGENGDHCFQIIPAHTSDDCRHLLGNKPEFFRAVFITSIFLRARQLYIKLGIRNISNFFFNSLLEAIVIFPVMTSA